MTAVSTSASAAAAVGPHRSEFRSDVQGLRTLAVAAVVVFHASAALLPGGFVGVDVFFVISGYLISSHLVRQLSAGRFRFADFYARRIRRLVPAALLVLVVTLIASYVLLSPLRITSVSRDAAATALYVPNIWFSYTGVDYLADHTPSPYQQYWSLGVEEQFYLVWPLLLVVAWKLGRGSLKIVTATLVALLVVSFGLSVLLTPQYETWAFFNLPMRAWQFAVGGAVGLAHLTARPGPARGPSWLRPVLAWLGLTVVVACCVLLSEDVAYPGAMALVPTVGTALVLWASRPGDRLGPSALLDRRPMQWLGDRSYSIYLWHWPLLIIPAAMIGSLPLWVAAIMVAATLVLAHVTYLYVENPARNAGVLKRMRAWRFLALSAVVVGVVAVAAVASGSILSKRPIASDQTATPIADLSTVEFTPYVPANGVPILQNAGKDLPKASEDGCSPGRYSSEVIVCAFGEPEAAVTYALFGDSHAAQWFPVAEQIATRDGARLLVVIKASCPSVDLTSFKDGLADTFCTDWREAAVERLTREGVDHVIVANLHHQSDGDGGLVGAAEWSEAAGRTVAALAPSKVTVVADTPYFKTSPINCAIAHVDDLSPCIAPRDDVIDARWVDAERAAVEAAGGTYADMSDLYCSDVCGPYIGDTLVYRDNHHLTASFTETLAEPLGEILLPR
ncbi:acyltransferase family protein [Microbacterium phosphatis]|uniref:acyltransferase family protein n=1 Tax=Microbacterium phosphatis TaxID=3140248 RepID=UPI0031409D69